MGEAGVALCRRLALTQPLLLAWLHAQAAAQQRTGSVIELRALQALAHAAGGGQIAALAALAEASAAGRSRPPVRCASRGWPGRFCSPTGGRR
jgi:hypothetical protein